MVVEALAIRFAFAGALALLAIGIVMAMTSANVVKRLGGALIALLASLVAAASLGAPAALLGVGSAVALATLALGAAIVVRLQESYGAIEVRDLNEADIETDHARPEA